MRRLAMLVGLLAMMAVQLSAGAGQAKVYRSETVATTTVTSSSISSSASYNNHYVGQTGALFYAPYQDPKYSTTLDGTKDLTGLATSSWDSATASFTPDAPCNPTTTATSSATADLATGVVGAKATVQPGYCLTQGESYVPGAASSTARGILGDTLHFTNTGTTNAMITVTWTAQGTWAHLTMPDGGSYALSPAGRVVSQLNFGTAALLTQATSWYGNNYVPSFAVSSSGSLTHSGWVSGAFSPTTDPTHVEFTGTYSLPPGATDVSIYLALGVDANSDAIDFANGGKVDLILPSNVYYTSDSGVFSSRQPAIVTQPSDQAVKQGATASFSAVAGGSPTPTVRWQVSANGGSTWTDIGGATLATYTFTPTLADSGKRYRAVFVNGIGSAVPSNAAALAVYGPPSANPSPLRFAAVKAGAGSALTSQTPAQVVTVTFSGAPSSWTASSTQTWLAITGGSGSAAGTFTVALQNPGNVIGASTLLSGSITITAPTAPNSPLSIPVTLTVDQTGGATRPPIGLVDTPAQNAAGVVGAVGVTGWVVDDVGVRSVKIYRNCLAFEPAINCAGVNGQNLAFVGDATVVSGARPDIEALYTNYPQAQQAAWGYLLLTNLLPHVPKQLMFGGQGPLTLYVLAEDMEGHKRWLGRSFLAYPTDTDQVPTAFTMANDTIAKPFGAIDTPAQGQTVSGMLANFGWVLTPDGNTVTDATDIVVPVDGSTLRVFIDGAPLAGAAIAYNQCRGSVAGPTPSGVYCDDDVSSIFGNPTPLATFTPRVINTTQHRNLDAGRGAIGAYLLDTTVLANGVHTIMWGVTDTAGRGEGLGSRFFTVLNNTPTDALAADRAGYVAALELAPSLERGAASQLEILPLADGQVWGRTGIDLTASYVEVPAGDDGVRRVAVAELGRLELWLGPVEAGYVVANGTLRDLPPGSKLDPATGQFTWAPGPGYVGTYRLTFARAGAQVPVDVTIGPAAAAAAPGEPVIRMSLDTPATGATVSGTFVVAGWALDPRADIGSGIDAVHVWAKRIDEAGSDAVFLGAAAVGGTRADVAKAFGAAFGRAGFSLTTGTLTPGVYDVTAYVWNHRTARWEDARTSRIDVR